MLGINKPHEPVSASTVFRWIKNVMSLSEIEASLFKGRSTLLASTSRASLSGVSVQEILRKCRWYFVYFTKISRKTFIEKTEFPRL